MSLHYSAYGLEIASFLPLPELPHGSESDGNEGVDVVIRRGVCEFSPDVRLRERYARLHDGIADFYWRGVGSFRVQEREIIVEPEKDVADDLLRPFLLGPLMAVVLHLRHYLVLHCSAVALPGLNDVPGVVAFLGQSRQGKSTMATALKERGYNVISDDIIAVPTPTDFSESPRVSPSPQPLIYSGGSYLKLRQPSVETFFGTLGNFPLWHSDNDSYVVQHENYSSALPLPLRALYLLEVTEGVAIKEMELPEALMALVNHSYCVRGLDHSEVTRNFFQCSWLAQQTPVFRLQRPHDFSLLPQVVSHLEEHQMSFAPLSEIRNDVDKR